MRWLYLTGSFVALLAALGSLWAFRYQRSPDLPVWRLADLRLAAPQMPGVAWTGAPDHPNLRIQVDSTNPRVAARLAIPGIPVVESLQLRFRLSSVGLIPGKEPWEDGRFIVEWHPLDHWSPCEIDPVGSIRLDCRSDPQEFVVNPSQGPAIPALRLEHLGVSGAFELTDLEIIVVEERWVWRIGKWILAAGFVAWGFACVRSWSGIVWWRALCASFIWVWMGTHFVLPGPWKIQRAMTPAFQIGGERKNLTVEGWLQARQNANPSGPVLISGPIPALGKIAAQGSLALRLKLLVAHARQFLHALLLFAPALVIALLVGRGPAVFLTVALALAIELAQVALGYGFDRIDVLDLATDAFGIALAMWVYGRLKERGRLAHIR